VASILNLAQSFLCRGRRNQASSSGESSRGRGSFQKLFVRVLLMVNLAGPQPHLAEGGVSRPWRRLKTRQRLLTHGQQEMKLSRVPPGEELALAGIDQIEELLRQRGVGRRSGKKTR
jgi:hypothetical protein